MVKKSFATFKNICKKIIEDKFLLIFLLAIIIILSLGFFSIISLGYNLLFVKKLETPVKEKIEIYDYKKEIKDNDLKLTFKIKNNYNKNLKILLWNDYIYFKDEFDEKIKIDYIYSSCLKENHNFKLLKEKFKKRKKQILKSPNITEKNNFKNSIKVSLYFNDIGNVKLDNLLLKMSIRMQLIDKNLRDSSEKYINYKKYFN